MEKLSIGQIVKVIQGDSNFIGIVYENGNKGYDDNRVQDAQGNKHKHLSMEVFVEASKEEIETFVTSAGPELTKDAIIQREAAEVHVTVEQYVAWTEGQAPLPHNDEGEDDDSDDDEGEGEDD